jgi:hypothetical protein
VGGGVKAVERRRFEIPKKSWHGFCLVGIRQRSGGKAGRRKKGFALEVKKIPVEEDGISNRQDSTTFVPPLTSPWAITSETIMTWSCSGSSPRSNANQAGKRWPWPGSLMRSAASCRTSSGSWVHSFTAMFLTKLAIN